MQREFETRLEQREVVTVPMDQQQTVVVDVQLTASSPSQLSHIYLFDTNDDTTHALIKLGKNQGPEIVAEGLIFGKFPDEEAQILQKAEEGRTASPAIVSNSAEKEKVGRNRWMIE